MKIINFISLAIFLIPQIAYSTVWCNLEIEKKEIAEGITEITETCPSSGSVETSYTIDVTINGKTHSVEAMRVDVDTMGDDGISDSVGGETATVSVGGETMGFAISPEGLAAMNAIASGGSGGGSGGSGGSGGGGC